MKLLVHLPRSIVGDVFLPEESDDFVFAIDYHQGGNNNSGEPECHPGFQAPLRLKIWMPNDPHGRRAYQVRSENNVLTPEQVGRRPIVQFEHTSASNLEFG